MSRFLSFLFSSKNKDEANGKAQELAAQLVKSGKGKTHGVRVKKVNDTYQVNLYEKD